MFFEMDDYTGQDASVFDNNVIFGVRKSIKGASYAFKHTAGVYLYDFGGLVCTHNLIAGTQQGFYARRGGTARKGPPSNISVVNNLFADNRRWQVALPWDWTEDDTVLVTTAAITISITARATSFSTPSGIWPIGDSETLTRTFCSASENFRPRSRRRGRRPHPTNRHSAGRSRTKTGATTSISTSGVGFASSMTPAASHPR